MRFHALTFSENERTQLHQLYKKLTHYLETGESLPPEYFIRLRQSMQDVLYDQKELAGFWEAAQKGDYHHLHLTHEDKALLNLPWQIAIDTTVYPSVHISKGLPSSVMTPLTPQPGPLRILVMISSPEDLGHDKRLSYEEEEQVILQVLAPLWESGQVQISFTDDGTLGNLCTHLQQQPYHILYFSGHGKYEDGAGYLRLEDPDTLRSEYVTAQQFGRAVKGSGLHTPSLVFLSSCQSAQGQGEKGFRGIADELMHIGVPSVIAMAFSILDRYAIAFTAHLYRHLAERRPLTGSYFRALLAMQQDEQQQLVQQGLRQYFPSQWLIPQLYCSQHVTDIVDWQAAEGSLPPAAASLTAAGSPLLSAHDKNYFFIGRRRESAFLFNRLTQNQSVLIKGQGGVGKTAMAEHLAKRLTSRDPAHYCFAFNEKDIGIDGMITRLWQFLENKGRLREISFELHKQEDALQKLNLLVQHVSSICKPIWIFDNMESCQQGIAGNLKEEYQGWMTYVKDKLTGHYPVIFTGRYPIPELAGIPEQANITKPAGITDLSLNEVSFVDFYRKCLQLHISAIRQEQGGLNLYQAAWALYHTLGGNYRMLEFFDEIYKNDKTRMADLLRQLKIEQGGDQPAIELMDKVQERQAGDAKKIVFASLVDMLSEEEGATLHLMLHFRLPILRRALDMQAPHRNFDGDLHRLKDLTLIEEQVRDKGAFYYLTPLVREWLAGIRLPHVEFHPELAGDYFKYASDELTHTYGDIESAFRYYFMSNNIDKINEVGAWIASRYFRAHRYEDLLYFGKKVVEIAGVHTHEEVFNKLGLTCLKFGKHDEALTWLTKYMIAARMQGDKSNEAHALNAISQIYHHKDDYGAAMVWVEKSRQLAREHNLLENEAMALTNMGNLYVAKEEYEQALKIYEESLRIRKINGSRLGEIKVLHSMSQAYNLKGDPRKAIKALAKCIVIAQEIGESALEGSSYANIGMALRDMGEYDNALIYLKRGIAICEEIGDQEGLGRALMHLGFLYEFRKEYDVAIECLTKSAMLLKKFGYDVDPDVTWHLGLIAILQNDPAQALPMLLESLPMLRKNYNRQTYANTLFNIGEAYMTTKAFDTAIQYFEECMAIHRELRDKKGESLVFNRLTQVYAGKDDKPMALHYMKKSLTAARALRDRLGEALTIANIAELYSSEGEHLIEYDYLVQAYAIYADLNDVDGLYTIGSKLSISCMAFYPELLQEGLWLLEQTCEIGIQSRFPDVEDLINKLHLVYDAIDASDDTEGLEPG